MQISNCEHRNFDSINQPLVCKFVSNHVSLGTYLRDDLVSVIVIFIIDVYMRPGWKMLKLSALKSSRPLDRADYLQIETNPKWDEYEQKYISDRSQLRSLLRKNKL